MIDRLPFPYISASDTDGKVLQLRDFLIQFKEELEFILADMEISMNSKGETPIVTKEVVEESTSIYDIVNSELFQTYIPKDYIKKVEQRYDTDTGDLLLVFTDTKGEEHIFKNRSNIKLSVNYETGELEYE